ncbi:MAG: hypothetical protein RL557_633 [archaeon]|jgi:SOS-response transcriptional repressor LexA
MDLASRVRQQSNKKYSSPLNNSAETRRPEERSVELPVIDKKQWIPFYGAFRAFADERERKPSIVSEHDFLLYMTGLSLHAAYVGGSIAGISYLIYELTH